MATFESVMLAKELASSKAIRRADDESVAMIVRYTGSSATSTVEVEAGGDIKFVEGAGADASMKIGSTDGTLDVSNASGDTMGEIVDFINADPNWEAVLVDALRADSSDNTLATLAATDASGDDGLNILYDTSVLLNIPVSCQNEDLPSKAKTDAAYMNRVYEIVSKNTYTQGTSEIEVYKCVGTVETLIYNKDGGATTAEQTIDLGEKLGIDGTVGGRVVVRLIGESHCTGSCEIRGKTWKVQ